MSTELKTLESDVIAIPDDIDLDKLGRLIDAVRFAKEFVGTIDALLKCKMMDLITERGDLTVNGKLWWIGKGGLKHEIVDKDNATALEKVFEVTGGDFASVADLLGSTWLKYGSFRKVCEAAGRVDIYDKIVKTTRKGDVLKSEDDEPERILCSVDKKFLTKGKVTA